MTAHTPEPWQVDDLDVVSAAGKWIGSMTQQLGESADIGEANAARIIACVNACKGIDPESIQDMRDALESIERDCRDWLDGKLNASAAGEFHKFANRATAALTKARVPTKEPGS